MSDAIEGGCFTHWSGDPDPEHQRDLLHAALLDPEAWKAVADERGWKDQTLVPEWRVRWNRFYGLLAEGRTIPEALMSV